MVGAALLLLLVATRLRFLGRRARYARSDGDAWLVRFLDRLDAALSERDSEWARELFGDGGGVGDVVERLRRWRAGEDAWRPTGFVDLDDLVELPHGLVDVLSGDDPEAAAEWVVRTGRAVEWLSGLTPSFSAASAEVVPPKWHDLVESLTEGSEGGKLSAGGRAFAKHRIRNTWWGNPTAGAPEKLNETAAERLQRIQEDAAWRNVFFHPDGIMYEVRSSLGFGARWRRRQRDEWEFRGFLEPPMENGHEKRWRRPAN